MSFVNSNNIKVYPTAYRGADINAESRLNSEFNITKRINQTFRSFVIRPVTPFVKTDINDSTPDDSKYSLEFSIYGYWFYVKALGVKSFIPDGASYKAVWAHIKVWPLNGTTVDYQAWSLYSLDTSKTTSILDTGSKFYGIDFLTETDTTTTYTDTTNDKYLLLLVKGDDDKWSVPSASLLALTSLQIEDSLYKGFNLSEKFRSNYINNTTFDGVTINGTTGNITNINFENITDNLKADSTKGIAELRNTIIKATEVVIDNPNVTIQKVTTSGGSTTTTTLEQIIEDSGSFVKNLKLPLNIGTSSKGQTITHYGDLNINNNSVAISKAESTIGLYNNTYIGTSAAPKSLTHYGDWDLNGLVSFTQSSSAFQVGKTTTSGTTTTINGVPTTHYGSFTQYTNDATYPIFKINGGVIELGYQCGSSQPTGVTTKNTRIKIYTGEGSASSSRQLQVYANSWDTNPYIKIYKTSTVGEVFFGTSSSNKTDINHDGDYYHYGTFNSYNIVPQAHNSYDIGSNVSGSPKWYSNVYANWFAGSSAKVDVIRDTSSTLYLTGSSASGYADSKATTQAALVKTTGVTLTGNTISAPTSSTLYLNGPTGVKLQYNASTKAETDTNGLSVTGRAYSSTYLYAGTYVYASSYAEAASYMKAPYFLATSDRNLKENIKSFHCDKSILNLDVKEFDFKKTGTHHIGCIAQDLQKICPEIVHEGEDGYLTIEENKIVYLLLDEVKKLNKKVEKLEKQLKTK